MITRRQWSRQFCFCFKCGYTSLFGDNLETHEIANGPVRQKALKEPATWLRLCNGFANNCHDAVQGKLEWPVFRQLALKKMYDPEHYDRVKVNLLRGREPDAITEKEVDEWVRRMEKD
ncbi:hypothetical protein LCGC14_1204730 [marine sediment metagenome]|uniref:Uncharacterized protein n=1 Tax=marine sediment metagenome TaxID=412755 RepID=A0A0F9LKA4_9ZZZZ